MFFRIARRIAWKLDCVLLSGEEWAAMTVRNDRTQELNKKAKKVAAYAEELLEENKQLRAAYDALLEEMAQLTEGQA